VAVDFGTRGNDEPAGVPDIFSDEANHGRFESVGLERYHGLAGTSRP
jgi:hypothetical protein